MKVPKRLQPLVEEGIINEVLRRLMSGKEADIFIVRCGEEIRLCSMLQIRKCVVSDRSSAR